MGHTNSESEPWIEGKMYITPSLVASPWTVVLFYKSKIEYSSPTLRLIGNGKKMSVEWRYGGWIWLPQKIGYFQILERERNTGNQGYPTQPLLCNDYRCLMNGALHWRETTDIGQWEFPVQWLTVMGDRDPALSVWLLGGSRTRVCRAGDAGALAETCPASHLPYKTQACPGVYCILSWHLIRYVSLFHPHLFKLTFEIIALCLMLWFLCALNSRFICESVKT